MNMRPLFLGLAALATFSLASCGSAVARRIEKNPQIFAKLTESEKAQVRKGQIAEGMGKEAVFLAWGRPDRVSGGKDAGKTVERWSYMGYDAVQGASFGFGIGGGYWGGYHPFLGGCYAYDPFYQPSIAYVPFEARRADFSNGRVIGWLVAH